MEAWEGRGGEVEGQEVANGLNVVRSSRVLGYISSFRRSDKTFPSYLGARRSAFPRETIYLLQ